MIIPIKESKQQLEILLQNLKIPDPNEVDFAKRVDGLFTVSTIDIPTNGVEKNQNLKVYSNFNSGFGGPILIYQSNLEKNNEIIFSCYPISTTYFIHNKNLVDCHKEDRLLLHGVFI